MEKAKRIGMEAYIAEQNEKVSVLTELLSKHNDGRRKSFFCMAVNLLDLSDVQAVMGRIDREADSKTVVRLFEDMASQRGISLKKRKKHKE
jgi:hypothetical protein